MKEETKDLKEVKEFVVPSLLDQFRMSKLDGGKQIPSEFLVMDSQVEEESLQSVLDKIEKIPVVVDKRDFSDDEMVSQ